MLCFMGYVSPSQLRRSTPKRIRRRSSFKGSRRALPGSPFGQRNADRPMALVCLTLPKSSAIWFLERPGEAFRPAKVCKLRLPGPRHSPYPALGEPAFVIRACGPQRVRRNPFTRHHEARRRRRAETRGPGFLKHRSPTGAPRLQIQIEHDDPFTINAAGRKKVVRQPREARTAALPHIETFQDEGR